MKLRAINYKFLGSILYYYRNDHKYSREKLVKIIYDDTHKSISAKTIQRIEEGTISKLSDVYMNIANVYGFDFIKDDRIYAQINELCIKSCNIINSGEVISVIMSMLFSPKRIDLISPIWAELFSPFLVNSTWPMFLFFHSF